MMRMIFIFGFAKKYLLEKKLGHFEKSFRAGMASAVVIPGFVINLRAFFKGRLGRCLENRSESYNRYAQFTGTIIQCK